MASYSKNAIYLILIIVVFTAFLGVIYSSLEIDNNNRGPLATEIFAASRNIFYPTATRLQQYCSIITPVRGSHSVDIHDSWELQYLTINIRHGDRTAINHIVGTSKNYGNMKGNNSYFIDEEALKHVYRLKAFDLDPLPRGQKLKHKPDEEHDLKAALNPKKALRKSDYSLAPGQLTSRGFMQHVHLGQLLHSYYGKEFLDKLSSSYQVYVRSTNYARTVQSVSALLISLVPHLIPAKIKIRIQYYTNEEDEIMHGLGKRASSHSVTNYSSNTEETVSSGGCDASVRLAELQERSAKVNGPLLKSLEDKLGPHVKVKTMVQLADAALPSYCHARPLPCAVLSAASPRSSSALQDMHLRVRDAVGLSASGGGAGQDEWPSEQCLQTRELEMIMTEADKLYCERFSGPDGGFNSTKLSIYPFLKEVSEHLVTAALGGAKRSEKLSVFSGHDTVIAPVLAGLGVYRNALCVWPGYASRVVFELWQPKAGLEGTIPSLSEMSGLKTLFPDRTVGKGENSADYARSFVRVFFNGQDVTQLIPTCAAERTSPAHDYLTHVHTDGFTLCSLDALLQQVGGLVDPYGSITEACAQ